MGKTEIIGETMNVWNQGIMELPLMNSSVKLKVLYKNKVYYFLK